MHPHNVIGLLSLCGLLIVSFTAQLSAATASAASSGPLFDPGNGTFISYDPTANDTITWKSGPNHADGATYSHNPTTETKFAINPTTGKPVPFSNMKGFSYVDPPNCDKTKRSCAITTGTGNATYRAKGASTAAWTVTASGALGPSTAPSWDSTASGVDPWTVSATDLIGLSNGYSMFFTAGLGDATFSPNGSVGFDVVYSTASGSTDLLDILLDSSGVHVSASTSAPFSVSIFSVPSIGADPTSLSGTPLNLSQLQALLQSDLSGSSLSSPINLGFLLSNLTIPTVDMGNGVLAQIFETSTANDSAQGSATPEPGTMSIFGCGIVFIAVSRYRLRK
jgi:hypothetical protein